MTEGIRQSSEPGVAAAEGVIPLCVPEVRGREDIHQRMSGHKLSVVGRAIRRML